MKLSEDSSQPRSARCRWNWAFDETFSGLIVAKIYSMSPIGAMSLTTRLPPVCHLSLVLYSLLCHVISCQVTVIIRYAYFHCDIATAVRSLWSPLIFLQLALSLVSSHQLVTKLGCLEMRVHEVHQAMSCLLPKAFKLLALDMCAALHLNAKEFLPTTNVG